jgi:hypothetical protein
MIHSPRFEAECVCKYGLKHVHVLTEMHRESMSLYHFHICGIPRKLYDFFANWPCPRGPPLRKTRRGAHENSKNALIVSKDLSRDCG